MGQAERRLPPFQRIFTRTLAEPGILSHNSGTPLSLADFIPTTWTTILENTTPRLAPSTVIVRATTALLTVVLLLTGCSGDDEATIHTPPLAVPTSQVGTPAAEPTVLPWDTPASTGVAEASTYSSAMSASGPSTSAPVPTTAASNGNDKESSENLSTPGDSSAATTAVDGLSTEPEDPTAPPAPSPAGVCANKPTSVADMAAFVIMPGFTPDQLPQARARLSGPGRPGGFFVGGNPNNSQGQTLRSIQDDFDVLIAIDDEGGRVQGIQNIFGALPAPAAQGSAANIAQLATTRGQQLAQIGVNIDFAPVVDIRSPASEGVIGDRSYGDTPEEVVERAGAFAQGLRSQNVIPTLKHFPGHGFSSDTHRGPATTPPWDEMIATSIVPFRRLLTGRTAVMMGHLQVPGLTGGEPATVSPAAYAYLRNDLGFNQLVVTDDLSGMKAITSRYSPAQAAVRAIAAGADVALFASDAHSAAAQQAIQTAVASGQMSQTRLENAVDHIWAATGCQT